MHLSFKLSGSLVLAINKRKGNRQAVLVDMGGGFTNLDSFSFPSNTEVDHSCSLVFNNSMFLFGGRDQKRQISRVVDCGLKHIGNLDFDFRHGAVTVIQSQVLLCFNWIEGEGQVCRIASSPTGSFSKIQQSNYHHFNTKIASNGGK